MLGFPPRIGSSSLMVIMLIEELGVLKHSCSYWRGREVVSRTSKDVLELNLERRLQPSTCAERILVTNRQQNRGQLKEGHLLQRKHKIGMPEAQKRQFVLAQTHQASVPSSPLHSLTYRTLLKAGSHIRSLQQVHAHIIISGLHHNRALLTKLITLACSAGSIVYTRQLFFFVPNPDSFLFNSLIRASSRSGFPFDSIVFYQRMHRAGLLQSNYTFTAIVKVCADLAALKLGKVIHSHVVASGFGSDPFVQAALVTFYAKSGDLVAARKVFDKMPERTIIAWNSMISGYEQNGFATEAVELFYRMLEMRVEPDSATLVSLLSACSQLGALDLGRWVNNYIVDNGFSVSVILGTSLINMYARCGNVSKAREVFDGMLERNVVAWTAMISGYGMHGYGSQAIELFHHMRNHGPPPNDVTFVAILSACAHSGLVNEGHQALLCMSQDYGFLPRMEHHVCMVDLLGRAGFLNEAVQYIEEMIPGEPAPSVWTAMLGACKMHKNFNLGVEVAEHLLTLEPDNPGHYVLLSNIYASAGRMDRVERVRNMMIHKGLKKQVGYSLIEINFVTHMFCMGDKSHPRTTEIYQFLDELIWKSREAGYVPESDSVMHELEEEEREIAVRFHSEKLAVAFGLMTNCDGTLIRVVKNLRMCGDCHSAIKFMSIVANREIIVRDKHRFHHFKHGSCSCQDYW